MRFGERDLADLAVLLRDVARAEVMPRFRNLGPGAVRTKADALDVVTDADEAAEAAITAGLTETRPKQTTPSRWCIGTVRRTLPSILTCSVAWSRPRYAP